MEPKPPFNNISSSEQSLNHESGLDPSKYHARIRVMKDPIETIRCWYLQDSDLSIEPSVDFERHAPLMISINGFNLKSEAEAYVVDEGINDGIVADIVKQIPAPSSLRFHLNVSVNAVRPPDKKLLTSRGRVSFAQQIGDITVSGGEGGFSSVSDVFDAEQQRFFLELMSRTLESTLDKAKKGRVRYSEYTSKASDEIVYDHSLITATDEDLNSDLALESDRIKYGKSRDVKVAQLAYIKASIDEAKAKIQL